MLATGGTFTAAKITVGGSIQNAALKVVCSLIPIKDDGSFRPMANPPQPQVQDATVIPTIPPGGVWGVEFTPAAGTYSGRYLVTATAIFEGATFRQDVVTP
jgi:hypothetical protein